MSKIISVEQADGSTIAHNVETGRTFRFPSHDEVVRNMSDHELWAEVHMGCGADAPAHLTELARRGDPDAIRALNHRGIPLP
jgi:hypothetical protein